MDQNRILELAIEELEKRKAGIDAEIETIRAELNGDGISRITEPVATIRSRAKTLVRRKAQSDRMKKIWAKRTRQTAAAKKRVSPGLKRDRSAINKSISIAMKAAWAKRKAKRTGTTRKSQPEKSKVSKK
jgi:hypothetical protein